MTSIYFDDLPSFLPITYSIYKVQNVTEKKALDGLKENQNNSWLFRYDYITKKYFLTIKNYDEYINHHVYYYNKNTDEVIIFTSDQTAETFPTLEDFINEMNKIYGFDLDKQIFI